MRVIDWTCDQSDLTGTQLRYIKNCWIRVKEMGYKAWLEAPEGESVADGLIPLVDWREDGLLRGVHGYISFGFVDLSAYRFMTPDIFGVPEPVWARGHAMWLPQQFINWKENYYEPQLHADAENGVTCHYPNAVRIWLRDGVRAYGHFNVDVKDGWSGGAKLRSDGVDRYDTNNPTNRVSPTP